MAYKLQKKEHYYYYHWEFFKSDLDITRVFVEKNYSTDMHEQEFYEINIITKGEGIHFIEENEMPAKLGDVFIIPPHVTHGYIGGDGFNVYHMLLSDSFIRKFITDLQQLPNFFTLFTAEPLMRTTSTTPLYLSINRENYQLINEILNQLLMYENSFDPISNLLRTNLCMVFISHLCRIYSENIAKDKIHDTSEDESFMKSISYIHENYNKKITINDLCEIAHMSRSSYIRKFKEICKIPPSTYITQRRIESAKNMLANTSYSISEIAYRTGFYDTSHFTKTFELETNLTPANYRKQHLI